MAGSYNKIIIIGHLGRDPDSRYLPSGDAVTTFSIATTERRRDGNEQTLWFRVSAFGKLAETCSQYLHRGSYAYIEGILSTSTYTDREGQNRTTLEVRARELRMLDTRVENGDPDAENGGHTPAGPAAEGGDDSTMDDIPF